MPPPSTGCPLDAARRTGTCPREGCACSAQCTVDSLPLEIVVALAWDGASDEQLRQACPHLTPTVLAAVRKVVREARGG